VRKQSEFFWHYRNSYYPLASRSSCNLRENPNMNEQFFFFVFGPLLGDTFQKDPLERASQQAHESSSPMPLKHGTTLVREYENIYVDINFNFIIYNIDLKRHMLLCILILFKYKLKINK